MRPTLVMEPEPPEPPEDELSALIRAAGEGDERAWERLVGLYARRVYALARSRRLSPEMSEEIAQSVFVTLAQKLGSGQYDERGRFESWLFRVAMNRIRDEARRQKRQATPSDPAGFVRVESDDEPVRSDASSAALRDALAGLNDADRQVIELRHHGQMSFKQIAELLGEPVGTLLARHHRALRKLRDMLGGADETPRKADAS